MTAHSNHGGFVLPLDPPSRFPIPVLLAAANERLYDLNVGTTPLEEGAPHEKPHVSQLIDPRRSNGERELAELSGQSLLPPKDPAFHPEQEGLR
jgi:hypothetical protein